jgi:hypothetical protein
MNRLVETEIGANQVSICSNKLKVNKEYMNKELIKSRDVNAVDPEFKSD